MERDAAKRIDGELAAVNDSQRVHLLLTLPLEPVRVARELSYPKILMNNRRTSLATLLAGCLIAAVFSKSCDCLAASVEPGQSARLINLSIRTYVGTGDHIPVVGFSVGGGVTKQLLVRGIGPSLAHFGVPDVIRDPLLEVFVPGNPTSIASTYGIWSLAAYIFPTVGAFPLSPPDSKDGALLLQLAPGGYTARLSGVQFGIIGPQGFAFPPSTGAGLIEIYDADANGSYASRLTNLSARNYVEGESNVLIAGFVIGGAGKKTVLIRGIGPTLGNFGITAALADPKLELYAVGTDEPVQTNDDWGGDPFLASTFASVAAFPLESNSKDAALLVSLPAGGYTVHVVGAGGTAGVALAEIYEIP